MKVSCPHCSARVEIEPRHGLAGSLCPECHQVVATPRGARRPVTGPRLSLAERPDARPTCAACGEPRERDARRCASCREPWIFRTVALSADDGDAAARLLEYVVRRTPGATDRAAIEARLRRLPAVALDNLTEAQAQRVRLDLESFGVRAAVEPDDAAEATATPRMPRPTLAWLAAPALGLFALGLFLLIRSGEPVGVARPATVVAPSVAEVGPDAALGPGGPAEALEGLVALPAAPGHSTAFVVDPDGWVLAPATAVDDAGGVGVRTGGDTLRGSVARTDAALGLALVKLPEPTPRALSLGDASALGVGDPVFVPVEGDHGPTLVRTRVVRPDHHAGRRLFVRLGAVDRIVASGAPVLAPDGAVVAVVSERAEGAELLAHPANFLTEGLAPLMAEIRPPRPPSPTVQAWLQEARAAHRAAFPAVYAAVEARLLLSATCDAARCRGRAALLGFEPPQRGLATTIELAALGPDQPPQALEPRHGLRPLGLTENDWRRAPAAGSSLLEDLPLNARREIEAGELPDLVLWWAPFDVEAPPPGTPARLVLRAPGGRRSGLIAVGDEPALVAARPTAPAAARPVPPPVPATPRYGPFTGAEWRGRFEKLRGEVRSAEERLAELSRRVGLGDGSAEAQREREARQLERLRSRLGDLTAEADRFGLPPDLRP